MVIVVVTFGDWQPWHVATSEQMTKEGVIVVEAEGEGVEEALADAV